MKIDRLNPCIVFMFGTFSYPFGYIDPFGVLKRSVKLNFTLQTINICCHYLSIRQQRKHICLTIPISLYPNKVNNGSVICFCHKVIIHKSTTLNIILEKKWIETMSSLTLICVQPLSALSWEGTDPGVKTIVAIEVFRHIQHHPCPLWID